MSETRTFHPALAAADVEEGTVTRVVIADKKIGIYRLEGALYALDDTCTHMKARLSNGYIEGGTIACPVHFGKFDIKTGKASSAPCTIDLATYPVKVENGQVFVGI
jgi:nitrite reductase/ring-hydroxylating ferredoxin subunit